MLLSIILFTSLSGCTQESNWSITVNGDSVIDRSFYNKLENCNATYDDVTGVPLECFLYCQGIYPVTSVSFSNLTFDWKEAAGSAYKGIGMLVLPDGSIYYAGTRYTVDSINVGVTDSPGINTSLVAGSVLYVLGVSDEKGLIENRSDRVVLFYIDGMGSDRYEFMKSKGLMKNVSSIGEPVQALCVYPSISRVNSKTLVTGITPDYDKGNFRSMFPDGATIFDRLSAAGKKGMWIDGTSVPVLVDQTRNCIDRNHDGSDDDEVADEAIMQYQSGKDFIIVHFDDTDSSLHDSGPYSESSVRSFERIDALTGKVMESLAPGTLVIIYSDHGGHDTANGGDHGTLLPDDMLVPILFNTI